MAKQASPVSSSPPPISPARSRMTSPPPLSTTPPCSSLRRISSATAIEGASDSTHRPFPSVIVSSSSSRSAVHHRVVSLCSDRELFHRRSSSIRLQDLSSPPFLLTGAGARRSRRRSCSARRNRGQKLCRSCSIAHHRKFLVQTRLEDPTRVLTRIRPTHRIRAFFFSSYHALPRHAPNQD